MTITFHAWFVWLVVAVLAVNALGTVVLIGVPRKPITRGQAAWRVFWSCAYIVLLAMLVTR